LALFLSEEVRVPALYSYLIAEDELVKNLELSIKKIDFSLDFFS
jgi:hypothetical protein